MVLHCYTGYFPWDLVNEIQIYLKQWHDYWKGQSYTLTSNKDTLRLNPIVQPSIKIPILYISGDMK